MSAQITRRIIRTKNPTIPAIIIPPAIHPIAHRFPVVKNHTAASQRSINPTRVLVR